MNIVIMGTGYVGLVTGACLAEMGNHVTCVDIDEKKIAALKKSIIPIYEPGLEYLVHENYAAERLAFVTSLEAVKTEPMAYFIAVGTPGEETGSADLRYVLSAARDIGRTLNNYAVIIDKSTVPVGTAEKVRAAIQEELIARQSELVFDVVSNPEFLKEGSAINDFMRPDRVVVGTDSTKAKDIMKRIYAPFTHNHERTLFMGIRDAEMTKYAANAMLSTRISFINEIANLCDRLGVDVENVRQGIGSDKRIGFSFIYPGCGYGGSCFPKDVRALVHLAKEHGFDPLLLQAVDTRNQLQKNILAEKLIAKFGEQLSSLHIGVWGLSFKPETDDMREAPAVVFLKEVISRGAKVRAFDPVANEIAKQILPQKWFESGHLIIEDQQEAVVKNADALVLVTEWRQFRSPDFEEIKRQMRGRFILDGRNQYDPAQLRTMGFEYAGIGR